MISIFHYIDILINLLDWVVFVQYINISICLYSGFVYIISMSEKYFEKMIELLKEINTRLSNIEKTLGTEISPISSLDLLTKIPKSHLDTYFAVQKLDEATCKEVAKETGRAFNLESRYLVRLYDLGFLERKRIPISKPTKNNPHKRGTEVKYFIKESK